MQNNKSKADLLDALKAAQEKDGCVTEGAIRRIAAEYGIYPSEVYETATFYTMLSVGHKADHIVEVCGSTCCDAGNAKAVMEAIAEELGIGLGEVTADKKWFFRRCECLGRCDTAPNVVIDGDLLTNATADKVIECIRKAGK